MKEQSGIDLARKVILLEIQQGLKDRAATGGLEEFVKQWAPSAGAALADYAKLSSEERAARLERAIALLNGAPEPVAAAAARVAPPAEIQRIGTGLTTTVGRLKGIGPSNVRRLERLGIKTVRDMLYHFPARHVDYSALRKVAELQPGDIATVIVTVWEVRTFPTQRGFERIEALVADDTGTIVCVWFRRKGYFAASLRGRGQVLLMGRVESKFGRLHVNNAEVEPFENPEEAKGRWVPIYPLTEGLNSRWMRNQMKAVMDRYAPMLPEHLPESIRTDRRLLDLPIAVAQMHFPEGDDELARARRRLAFDELFVIQLGVAQRRRQWREKANAPPITLPPTLNAALRQSLPFELTGAQERTAAQIFGDLARRVPMARLLQGDVGAGKTVVAAMGALATAAVGRQTLFMAPTEILAEQHYRTVSRMLGAPPIRAAFKDVTGREGPEVALLTGSTRQKARRDIYAKTAEGSIDVLIGTHALIQEKVEVAHLGLGIVDEQHRFGVLQRSALRGKGGSAHLLVMTATPIPRTLAMTVYGELDVSIIDELPPGRRAIKTRWVGPDKRESAYDFLRKQVTQGRQAFVICPLVEESEKIVAAAATAEYERLRIDVFPDLRLGLLHGRMTVAEKDAAMAAFVSGETHVLVATTVVEVGIDVPNATVMLVEAADRFGLAQLHQLRGRVGRDAEQSYCILVSEAPSLEGQERLRVIEETTDGFVLAEADLRLRGPGEFLGVRQSGLPELKVASLSDVEQIEEARRAAFGLVEKDPELARPEHALLNEKVAELAPKALDLA